MPRDVRQRVEVTDEEDEEVRRGIMTDGDEDAAMAKKDEEAVEEAEGAKNEDDDEEADEEVYEIESIIHHKRKMFGKSTGFFVKWKGYPASDNSWVAEEDCNAPELISDYYASISKKARSTPRSKRSKDEDTEMEELPKAKKLKKKDTEKPSHKMENQSNGRTSLRAVNKEADTDAEMELSPRIVAQSKYGTMDAYRDEENWADIIDKIITVDYTTDVSNCVVYFLLLKNGDYAATTGEMMSRKAPALAIRFYENNLRFRDISE